MVKIKCHIWKSLQFINRYFFSLLLGDFLHLHVDGLIMILRTKVVEMVPNMTQDEPVGQGVFGRPRT